MVLKIKPSNEFKMYTFDVENLYTYVPVNETTEMVLDLIYKPTKITDIPFDRTTTKKLLLIAVTSVPFIFLNENYSQDDSLVMHSSSAPILDDVFMIKMETRLNRLSKNKPIVWLPYVDDIFCIFTIELIKIIQFQ
ncbi:unnamed protein product, partial [Rotaria sordida]